MSNRKIRRPLKVHHKLKLGDGAPQEDENCNRYETDLDSHAVVKFESGEYKLSRTSLRHIKTLGNGNYGSVDLRSHEPSGTIMAVKMMQISEQDKRNLKREIDVLKSSVKCPHVVQFYGAFFQEGTAFVCMEAMEMCLTKFYKVVFNKLSIWPMPDKLLGAVTVCVLRALHFLKKELNVIHRDVKPSNVLINCSGGIKMCDFGISGCLVDSRAKSFVGCLRYMAPELFDTEQRTNDGYDIRSDVWSLGITLLEISSGVGPFGECNTPYLFMDFLSRNDPPSPSTVYSESFANFISVCLQKDFHIRPYYDELMKHAFPIQYENTMNDNQYIDFVQKVVSMVEL